MAKRFQSLAQFSGDLGFACKVGVNDYVACAGRGDLYVVPLERVIKGEAVVGLGGESDSDVEFVAHANGFLIIGFSMRDGHEDLALVQNGSQGQNCVHKGFVAFMGQD